MATPPTIPAALSMDGLVSLDARAGFALAADAGYRGIAFPTNHRELSPDALGPSARRQVRTILAAKGLALASIRAAAPRGGLAEAATIDRTLENTRKAITLARELGVPTVSLNLGTLADAAAAGHDGATRTPPQEHAAVPESTVVAALRELAQQADAAGLTLAVSSSGGGVAALGRVLKAVDFERARVNLEGAAQIAAGENILQNAEMLAASIGQWTASDAVRAGRSIRAAPLGEGQLPLRELLSLLREQGFDGPCVVDVRDLPDGVAGARHAADVLRKLML